jgi:hypothetical protein
MGKRLIAILAILLLVFSITYASSNDTATKAMQARPMRINVMTVHPFNPGNATNSNRDMTDLFFEDFESGTTGWCSIDETDVPGVWHTDEYNAYEGSGHSWWMGDPDIEPNGGYLDHWYQVLDTPVIPMPSSGPLTLTFYQYRAIEEPGTHENFDGWDGFNIRISDDHGATWEILTDCTPAYNCQSMYSFGFEHGEDPDGVPGIPGWGGASGGWIYTTFTIPDTYIRKDVMIRFAFASDPAYCTADDPALIGVFVDNINVAGVFTNNGEDETGFTASSLVPIGGDLWHIYEDATAPSPTHAIGCFDEETGTYNPNMENYFISPKIAFPSGLDVTWDMWVETGLDTGTFPDCDFFYVEIRYLDTVTGEWSSFNSVSNPLQDPDIDNYVFTGSVEEWSPFSLAWPGYNDISCLGGHADSVQFRVGLHSNADNPTTIGFRVDNFEVMTELDVNPPTNLNAEYNSETGFVDLSWSAPSGLGGEMQWDDGTFENAISFLSGSGYIGEDFPVGGACTIQEFTVFSYSLFGSTTLGVFEKSGATYSSTPTYTMPIETQAGTPATYTVSWDVENDFIIAFECSPTIDCALDESTVPSEHSYVLSGGAWALWKDVATANQLPDGEFGIRCTTTYATVPQPNSYNVYRSITSGEYPDDSLANVVDTSFVDDTVEPGNFYYYVVTAVYDEGESEYSNEDGTFVEIATAEEYIYDDGTAESGYHAGAPGNFLAVRITPSTYPVKVIRVKFYLTSVTQQIVVRIWDDDGPGGEPGTQLLEPPLVIQTSNLIADNWNVITLPGDYDIQVTEGDFYVGWFEGNNACLIGLDTSGESFNRSYQYTDENWYDYNDGIPQNFMMRAVVDTDVGTDEQEFSQFSNYLLQNCPNPVRTSTTISYNLIGNKNQEVEIKIYNLLGQLVDTVKGKDGEAVWTPENIPNGIYFYKLENENFAATKKLVVLR